MHAELPRREYLDWRARFDAEPWGDERADLRMARLCHVLTRRLMADSEDGFLFKFGPPAAVSPELYKAKRMAQVAQQQAAQNRGKA